jgi:hypothetical protein
MASVPGPQPYLPFGWGFLRFDFTPGFEGERKPSRFIDLLCLRIRMLIEIPLFYDARAAAARQAGVLTLSLRRGFARSPALLRTTTSQLFDPAFLVGDDLTSNRYRLIES